MQEMRSDTRDGEPSAQSELPGVDVAFRNGTLTVSGVLLSFSLNFLSQWANNSVAWYWPDVPAILLMVFGILLQLRSLFDFLGTRALERGVFQAATHRMIRGVLITAIGVIAGIGADVVMLTLP